jgi:hypothetical protein
MYALLSFLAWAVMVVLACWLFSGVALRGGGALLAAVGLLNTAMTGSPSAAVLAVISGLTWLAGHWLFAMRHHYFRSPLARRVFLQALPRQFDSTRGWGIPNVPPGASDKHPLGQVTDDQGRVPLSH